MKKLKLNIGSIKEMLTKEQMKNIVGGYEGNACFITCPDGTSVVGERMTSFTWVEYNRRYRQSCCEFGSKTSCCPPVELSQEA